MLNKFKLGLPKVNMRDKYRIVIKKSLSEDFAYRIFIYKDNELTQKIGCGSELQACRLVDRFLATV